MEQFGCVARTAPVPVTLSNGMIVERWRDIRFDVTTANTHTLKDLEGEF